MVPFSKNESSNSPLSFALTGGLRATAAATNNKLVGALVVARAIALSRLAPLGLGLAATRGATLTTTMRVVDWVHGCTAHFGPAAHPARAARLADADIFVLHVAHLAYRGHAVD